MSSILKHGFICTLPLAALLATPSVQGQSIFFTGANGASWSEDSNWQGGVKPTTSQIAAINGNSGGSGSGGIISVDSNEEVGAISFSGSVAKTLQIAEGFTLTLHGLSGSLVSNVGNQNLSIGGSGQLVLASSGNISISNSNRWISITAKITETGGPRQIVKTGLGTLQLTNAQAAASTYSGGMRIEQGGVTTNFSTSGAANAPTQGVFGTGTLTFVDGMLTFTGNSAGTIHNRIAIEDTATIGNGTATQSLTFAGDIDLTNGTRTLRVQQNLTASGVIHNGALTKSGTSQLTLTGNNTYAGTTHIQEGTLRLQGSGSVASSQTIQVDEEAVFHVANSYALASGQTLKGTGTVEGTLRIGSGTIDPGANGIGQLNVEGNALLNGGAIRFELAQTGNDVLRFSGDGFTLTGNTTGAVHLSLIDFDGTAEVGSYLLISTNDLENGSFVNWDLSAFTLEFLPVDWIGSLRMENNNLYFDLQVIPEPSSALFGAALFTAWGMLGRRRKANV